MDTQETRELLLAAAERSLRYLEGLDARPVFPQAEAVARLRAALEAPLPEAPRAAAEVLAAIDDLGSPATVAGAGGRYFGFVTGGALPASVAAHWLATAWDQNAFSRISSPALACFEEAALRLVLEALDLPAEAEGALVTGATMGNFTCLAAARHRLLAQAGWDVEARGLFGAPEIQVVIGESAHASVAKVLALLGLGRERVVRVPVDDQGRLRPEALPELRAPTILCLQAGEVNSGAFDPAAELIPRAQAAGAWVHVDGAFGLWARAAPRFAGLTRGLEQADSWAADAHKWLNVPYDCGLALVRDPAALRGAFAVTGAYLEPSGGRDAIDLTPDNSRRARALDVWAALQALGRSGLAELVERNCDQARRFAEGLRAAGLEVLNDVVLNQVLVAFGDDARTARVLRALQEDGVCWCGGTRWRGRAAMRISVSSWATSSQDVEASLESILAAHEGADAEDTAGPA